MTMQRSPFRRPRLARALTAAALAAVVAGASGCSASEETPDLTVSDFFYDYVESTDVANDPFGNGGTSEDRMAQFAALGTPDQLFASLFAAIPCDAGLPYPADSGPDLDCPAEATHRRLILVRHGDESMEVMPLFVNSDSGRGGVLIDGTGETYTGGLDDFRAHNDLLDADDLILAPRDVTDTSGGRMVVATGHTSDGWPLPWLAAAAVAVLGVGGLVTFLVHRRRATDAAPTDAATTDAAPTDAPTTETTAAEPVDPAG